MSEERFQASPFEQPTDLAPGLPPVAARGHADPASDAGPNVLVNEPSATQVFLAWEKLRLLYNGVLVLVVLLRIALRHDMHLLFLLEGAISANLAFCAGPIVEGYLCWLGMHRAVRPLIFVLGMLIAIVLALSAGPQHVHEPFP